MKLRLSSLEHKGHLNVVTYLVEQKDASTDVSDKSGGTALMFASGQGHLEQPPATAMHRSAVRGHSHANEKLGSFLAFCCRS